MKKSTVISLIALAVALAGIAISLYTFFKRSGCFLCDSFDDDMLSDDLYSDDDCDSDADSEDDEPSADSENTTEE